MEYFAELEVHGSSYCPTTGTEPVGKKVTNHNRYHLRTKDSKEFSETTNNVEASRVSFWTSSLDQGVNVSGERSTCVAPTFFSI